MLRAIGRAILGVFGALLIIAGIIITIGGSMNGLGTPTIAAKAGFGALGVVLALAGFYALYLASGKNLSKLFENLIDGIFGGW